MKEESNIILVDKPKGISSYDVIRILQKKFMAIHGKKIKMGHAGTLDPLATGLLIIGVEKGTKQLHTLLGLSKVYEAEILLGKRTETGDIDGKVIEEQPVLEFSQEKIQEIVKSLEGVQELPVPIYSAIKRQGKALYEYARAGESIEVPIKQMNIISAELIAYEKPVVKIKCNVGSGTYIRSLAEELGKRLGTVATIQNLRRVSIGDFKIADAIKV